MPNDIANNMADTIQQLEKELKEWKGNPFRRIKAECKENYYCNNCAFIDHCPFANGNRVAAEYPMDWVIY